jgi:pyruvate formate lyase activating enzyme
MSHARELAARTDETTGCICYFGGDPGPQILHALKVARLAISRKRNQLLRICWETNGSLNQPYLNRMAHVSLASGGCIKCDLKAWDEGLHKALCGVTNRNTLENFQTLSTLIPERPDPPFLVASTLLVPGYVDEQEVDGIARFISRLDPDIPYNLLGFWPHFYLKDLPRTSRAHALRCHKVAEEAGLTRVHVGNAHMLGQEY